MPNQQHQPPTSPPGDPRGPATVETTILPAFGFSVERAGPEGRDRILRIIRPADPFANVQKILELPFDSESSKELSERLLAPSVPAADNDDVAETTEGIVTP